jgi:uncharacterized repeat protein (TIGR03803 family)
MLYGFEGTTDGGNPGRLAALDGALYGTARGEAVAGEPQYYGTVFAITPAGDEHAVYAFKGGADGAQPEELVAIGDALYGYAMDAEGTGLVFALNRSGGKRVLYRFTGTSGGDAPTGPLAYLRGTLFGTTLFGGKGRNGTVFALSLAGKARVVHAFGGGAEGANPESGLVVLGNALYGTTYRGGAHGAGTVFEVDASGRVRIVYSFRGPPVDGMNPNGALLARGGVLYGTTTGGGAGSHNGNGTVFAVRPAGDERVLHAFTDVPDGALPVAGLTAAGKALFGTTREGGTQCGGRDSAGCGTVFEIVPSGRERVLHRFAGGFSDGAAPSAEMQELSGRLYGTTSTGGPNNEGTVFEVAPPR